MPALESLPETQPVEVSLVLQNRPAFAGQWYPITLVLRRAHSAPTSALIRNISTTDAQCELDLDLFSRDLELRPGETYQVTVRLKVHQPGPVNLGNFFIQVHELSPGEPPPTATRRGVVVDPQASKRDAQLPFATRLLDFRAAIGHQVKILPEAICAYEEGTKVILTFHHEGGTTFENFTANILPADAIRAGKGTVQRAQFGPNDQEQIELVVQKPRITVNLSGSALGQRAEDQREVDIPTTDRGERRHFQFLEPRRLSRDDVSISRVNPDGETPVIPDSHGAFLLREGYQYNLVIKPQNKQAADVRLGEMTGILNVRNKEVDEIEKSWRFLLDVMGTGLLQRPEILFYDVVTQDEKLAGEVPLRLKSSPSRFWKIAGALGAALTLQGAYAAVRKFFVQEDLSVWEAFGDFDFRRDYNLLFLLSIPLAFFGLRCFDWLQYRLRT